MATDVPELVRQAAATAGAVVVLLGLTWRLVRPHVRDFVAEVRARGELVERELQPDSGSSLHDHARRAATGVEAVAARVDELEAAWLEHMADAGVGADRLRTLERDLGAVRNELEKELTIYRALLAGAGLARDPTSLADRRRASDRRDNTA